MEDLIVKVFAGAGPWAVLAILGAWKFGVYNDKIMQYNQEREERLISDARSREERYGVCIQRLEDAIERVAENQRIPAEEIMKLRENMTLWESRG